MAAIIREDCTVLRLPQVWPRKLKKGRKRAWNKAAASSNKNRLYPTRSVRQAMHGDPALTPYWPDQRLRQQRYAETGAYTAHDCLESAELKMPDIDDPAPGEFRFQPETIRAARP